LLIFAPGMAARAPIVERMTARVGHPRLRRWLGLAIMATAIYAIAFLVMWAIYGFEIRQLPGVPIPLPAATHLTSVLKAQSHLDVGHPTFLMGEVSVKGWWYYFPVAFLVKTPIPILILLVFSAVLAIRQMATRGRKSEIGGRREAGVLTLIVFVGAYVLLALFSAVEIGYRHLLPILPCLYVLAAQTSNVLQSSVSNLNSRFVAWLPSFLIALLLIWHVVGAVGVFPNYLTFFNEIIGGPQNGWKYLVDSNLDWGQSLIELRTYIAEHRLGRINLSATGFVNPAVYGIAYDPLPPMPNPQSVIHFDPKPGRYYIGAHNLQIGSPIDHDVFGWFREREPSEWIANAILVYDVPQRPAGKWVAQCAVPQAPLEPEAVMEGFGRDDLRLIYFDCQNSWVYPAGAPGWYIVGDKIQSSRLPPSLLREFRTGGLSEGARFTIYRLEAVPDFGVRENVQIGPLTFLCFAPREAGRVVANGDGLGVPVENWRPGDVIVQRHTLAVPSDSPPGVYQTQIGVYTLDDLSRFGIVKDGVTLGDYLSLAPVEVKR
jgi:hypothetical protein